jgi:hypothetical protein
VYLGDNGVLVGSEHLFQVHLPGGVVSQIPVWRSHWTSRDTPEGNTPCGCRGSTSIHSGDGGHARPLHLRMNVDPSFGIHRVVKRMKGRSSHDLRSEFPSLKSRLPRALVQRFDRIAVERKDITEMVPKGHSRGLHRGVAGASWRGFLNALSSQTEEAGSTVVFVGARGTTRDCSVCGQSVPKALWEREL